MKKYLEYIVNEIHSVVLATTDENGNPVTCVIDMMHYDESSLYFLTATTKNFYKRLKQNENIAITGFKGEDTMSCNSINIIGKAKEIGTDMLMELFDKNSYMYDIYKTEESRKILTVFKIYEGKGQFYDLSQKPIFTENFIFGNR